MTQKITAPYGSWKSPIRAATVASATLRLGQTLYDGDCLYWLEGRPSEGGRQVIVKCDPSGRQVDVIPHPFNARTLVHEYGGGAFTVSSGKVVFANYADQRLYFAGEGHAPVPLTPEGSWRYADPVFDSLRKRIVCIVEDHTCSDREPANTIAAIELGPGQHSPITLVSGYDFYAHPRISQDASKIAWLSWNHPNMPWDGTELWVAEFTAEGAIGRAQKLAGGPDESVLQPEWDSNGTLYFISDRSGWWNLYKSTNPLSGDIEYLIRTDKDFGMPPWLLGMSCYCCAPDTSLVCTYSDRGIWRLARISAAGMVTDIETPYTDFSYFSAGNEKVCFIAGSPSEQPAVIELKVGDFTQKRLKVANPWHPGADYVSQPELIEFPTDGGGKAYAFYYAPTNVDYQPGQGELPPLLVKTHGGPTGAATTLLNYGIQFWTSRGFAVLDVNYRGSSGYGREYRNLLRGQWGIVDVQDCCNAAEYLVQHGLADGNRLAITGGSAGGFTTLCALTFTDCFKAGASHYGISDLDALVRDGHKFESHYEETLVGRYPDNKDVYRQRSPLHHLENLSCPIIFFHGLEDKVCLPNQSEMMADALRQKALPVAYVPFAGEQHGFRKAESIQRALEAEFYFYSRVFDFQPADEIEPVTIENLPAPSAHRSGIT